MPTPTRTKATGLTRRQLLAGVAAAALVPLPLPALGGTPAPQGFHLVNGWILTSGDLVTLGLHDL